MEGQAGKTDGEEETSQEIAITGIDGEDIFTSTVTPSQLPLAFPETFFMFIMTNAMNPASMERQAKHKEKGPSYPRLVEMDPCGVW